VSDSRFNLLTYACLILLLLVSFHLRSFRLDEFPPGISRDESTNLVDGVFLSQSGRFPLYQDHERPEPLVRVYGALTALFFGNSVWAFRYTTALWGMLSFAAVFWASQQCFAAQPRRVRQLIGLLALASLASSLVHFAINRSLYRAVPLVFFAPLALGFTCRSLRRPRLRDFVFSGVCLSFGCYTYTAGLALPLAYPPLAINLAIFHRASWRRWLPGLLACAIVLILLTLPISFLLLTQPESILARASNVIATDGQDWAAQIRQLAAQLLVRGDPNPQYNIANAPLIPAVFSPFFIVGFMVLVFQLKQPAFVLVLSLLAAGALPTLLTDEVNGLRSHALFAVIPLLAGASIIPLYKLAGLAPQLKRLMSAVSLIGIVALGCYSAVDARRTYSDYWLTADVDWPVWRIHNLELSHSEWFFRTDKKFLADWISARDGPLLLPISAFDDPLLRAWLLPGYPSVEPIPSDFALPPQARIIVPWSLEDGRFQEPIARLVLLHDAVITVLPPLTDDEKLLLFSERAGEFELIMPDSAYPPLARIKPAPADWTPIYTQPLGADSLARFNGELNLRGYQGPDTISGPGKLKFELNWSVERPVSNEYGAFLQLFDPNWSVVARQDRRLWRWLFPTVLWPPGQIHSRVFTLSVDQQLTPGAYRLVAGAWHINSGNLLAESFVGHATGALATIGWLKVAPDEPPIIPHDALPLSFEFADVFSLRHMDVERADNGLATVELYWTSSVSRPNLNATVFLHAVDRQGQMVSQSDIQPWDGRYPTFIWDAGELVVTRHELQIPRADGVELLAGMYLLPDARRLIARSNGERLVDDIARLGAVNDLLND